SDWSSDVCSSDLRVQAARKKDAVGRTSQDSIDYQVAQLFDSLLAISWREKLRAQAVCHDVSCEGIRIPQKGLLRQAACSKKKSGNKAAPRHNRRLVRRVCAGRLPTRARHRSC